MATNATATSISTGQSLSVKLKIPHRVQPEFLPRPGLPGQYTNKLHYFKKHLLDEVVKKKFALDFMEPVDTVALQVPTYYTVIERPMDIGTIIKRVHNNYYRYVEEAISDFRLVLRNCFTFNCAGDVVYRKGQMLEKFFTKIIRGIPPGPEIPCHKDPRAMARPRGILKVTSAMIDMERECREQLNQLQHNSSLADTHARNFFNSKWESLHKKLDKHYFKSEEDFKSHVDAIFKKYYEGAKMIYENTYGRTSAQALGLVGAESSSAVIMLDAADVRTLCRTAELLENGLRYFVEVSKQKWETCTVKGLVDDFSDTINALRDRYEIQRFFGNQDSGVPCIAAHTMLREGELDFFSVPSDCEADFEEERHTFVGTDERRSVQKLFAMLPVQSMAEIVHIILQIEGFSMESNKHMNFDVQSFKQETLHLMKKSITRAVRATTKLNLRDMQPAEKDGLKRSLEQQLQDITKILNSGRAKKTIKAAARAKAQTDDGTPQMQRTATNYTRTLTDSSGSSESSDSSKTSESSASSSSSDSSESSSEEEEKSSVSSPAGSSQSNNAPSQDCVDGPNVSPLSQSMRSPMSTLSEQLMLSSTDISISSSQRSNCNSPDNCGESDNCSLPSSKAGSPPRTNELNLQFMSESDQHSIDRTLQLGQESMTTVSPPQINEHNSTSFAFKSDIPPLEKKSKTPESQYLTYESNQQALTPVSRLKPHIYQLDRAPITSTYGRNQQEFLTECSSQPSNYQLDQQIVMYGSPSQTYESNRKVRTPVCESKPHLHQLGNHALTSGSLNDKHKQNQISTGPGFLSSIYKLDEYLTTTDSPTQMYELNQQLQTPASESKLQPSQQLIKDSVTPGSPIQKHEDSIKQGSSFLASRLNQASISPGASLMYQLDQKPIAAESSFQHTLTPRSETKRRICQPDEQSFTSVSSKKTFKLNNQSTDSPSHTLEPSTTKPRVFQKDEQSITPVSSKQSYESKSAPKYRMCQKPFSIGSPTQAYKLNQQSSTSGSKWRIYQQNQGPKCPIQTDKLSKQQFLPASGSSDQSYEVLEKDIFSTEVPQRNGQSNTSACPAEGRQFNKNNQSVPVSFENHSKKLMRSPNRSHADSRKRKSYLSTRDSSSSDEEFHLGHTKSVNNHMCLDLQPEQTN